MSAALRPSVNWLGTSDMGRRIAAFDWRNHPLGPIESWPNSLKTTIQIMLNSRYAMWLGWGPEFYFFCNDAYLPTLGSKQNWLGVAAREVWREIWNEIGPRAESVAATGLATWDESLLLFLERSGYTEETYHTFSYSAVPDDFGNTGGMLCVVTEDTHKVVSERRLALLRELGAELTGIKSEQQVLDAIPRHFNAYQKDLPFSLVYIFDADGTHARLATGHGVQEETIAPTVIEIASDESIWPAARICAEAKPIIVADIAAARTQQVPSGPWSVPPHRAMVVPLGQQGHEKLAGFLVAGISSYRPFDSDYRGFIQLLADQIGAALSSVRAYEAERSRAEALAELDRAKTAFFSNVSHEFRTPLTLLLGPLEDSLTDGEQPLPVEQRDRLDIARRNGLRLLKLVNTLLDFSRIEAGRAQAVYQPTDLARSTVELAGSFRSACEGAGLKLILNCPPLSQLVYIDRDMWEKIVLNLVSNAFKYTLEGEIEISLSQDNGQAVLSVRDTGSGIPEDALPHLFERFYRVAQARGRTHEGTGIGLALVQDLVRLHGGQVQVTSTLGRGSTFRATMPLGNAHLPAERVNQFPTQASSSIRATPFVEEALSWLPAGNAADVTNRQGEIDAELPSAQSAISATPKTDVLSVPKPRLLWADDNSDMRNYVIRLLHEKYDIEAVADGEAALAAACAHPPDLIVSDIMMPKLDGLQLVRRLRAEPATQTLPVILLSARAGEERRIEGLQAGADDYLIKPFSPAELQARIAGLLTISAIRREADQAIRKNAEERQKFAALVENSQNFIAMASLDGAVIYINPAGRALIGLGAGDDPPATGMDDYLPAPAREYFATTVLPKVLEEGRWEGEVEFRHLRSGDVLPMYQTLFLVRYPENGGPLCLATVARNISAQKKAHAELRASEERYRELLHNLPAAVYTCDAQGRITFCNEAAETLWGRKPHLGEDAGYGSVRIYRPDGSPLPPDEYPMALALQHRHAVKGKEVVIERPDGTRRYALAHPQPLFDGSGAVVGAINMLVDVTESKIAQDALRASEEHLRLATQAGTLGIWDWDVAHNRVTWSDSLYPIHGLKPGEFGGTVEAFAELVHPDDRQVVSAAIRAALVDDKPFEIEFRIVRPGGETARIFTNAKILHENGHATHMIGATVDISARKRSDDALRDSEERIKQLVTLMPAAIYTCDAGGRITFFNRRAAELWKREPQLGELFTGAHGLWQRDGTLLRADQTPMAAAVREGRSIRDAELIIERSDGSRVVISANIEPFYDRRGQCTGAISVFQDISQRKTAERELQQRSQTIQLLSETLAQLLRANDPDLVVKNLFDKVAAHIGADSYLNFMLDSEGKTLELHSWSGIPEERVKNISPPEFVQAICGTVAETEQPFTMNDIQNSADEEAVVVRSLGIQTYTCNPLMVGDKLFGTLAVASHTRTCFDDDELEFLRIVSQYTAIALERLRSARALRGSEDRLAAELTSMQQLHTMTTRLMAMREIPAALHEVLDAVIEIQGADFGKIRVYNPALNGLEIVAQQGFEPSFIERHRVVTLEDDSASGRALRTKVRVVIEDVQSDAGTAADRRRAALAGYRAVQATPLISRGGDLLGMLLTHFRQPRRPTDRELRFVDLYARQAADFIELLQTKQELRESEERLRRQAEELEQQLIASGRLVSLGEITASMAHEFNNPLGIVLGFTEDLLSSAQPGDAIYRPLQIIEDEAKRCKRIIQDLMDYSRPRAANLSRTNVHDIVTKTLSLIENRLYKQKINLTTNIAADLPRLHADYQQLEQVLVNFYLNALDAMPRGGTLAVSAGVQGANGEASLIIAVSDTGFGIEKEAVARIFQPFYTAKKTRGLGLGLPICERIIKNHGGRIEVESTVGQGTIFKIVLPLSRDIL